MINTIKWLFQIEEYTHHKSFLLKASNIGKLSQNQAFLLTYLTEIQVVRVL